MDATQTALRVVQETCPLCGGSRSQELARYDAFVWERCPCGLIYKSQESAEHDQEALYGEVYFERDAEGRSPYDARFRHRVRKSKHQLRDLMRHAGPGPLLDVGCSLGYTLQAARELGLEATGMDVSPFAAARGRELGFDVCLGSLEELPFTAASFRLAILKHVFEHTPEPRSTLRELRRVLRPDGAALLAVPNAEYSKAKRQGRESSFYRPERGGTEHYVYYTPSTLTRLVEEEGFRCTRVHPHFVHPSAPWPVVAGELVTALPRMGLFALRAKLRVLKEFWMVVVPGR